MTTNKKGAPAKAPQGTTVRLNSDQSSTGDWAELSFTVFRSKNASGIRKNLSLDTDGNLLKGEVGAFFDGQAERVDGVPLSKLFNGFSNPPRDDFAFLTAGVNPEKKLTMGRLKGGGVMKRSLENFPFPEGPAVLIIDSDELQNWPGIKTPEDVLGVLGLDVDCVTSTSASSHLTWPKGQTGLKGLHTFFPIDCGTKIPEVLSILHQRAWLVGYGRIFVGGNGALHERSLVDRAMQSGNQCCFEYGAVLKDLSITQERQVKLHRGTRRMVRVDDIKPLTDEEHAEYQRRVAEAKSELKGKAEEATEAWLSRQLEKVPEQERQSERTRLLDLRDKKHRDLPPHFEITLNDGSRVTVQDILDSPEAWHYRSIRDPLEPEYGQSKATVFTKGQKDGCPKIISLAHGASTVYHLGPRPRSGIARGSLVWVGAKSQGRVVASQARDIVLNELQGRYAWSTEAGAWHTWNGSCWFPETGSEAMLKGLHDAVEIGCNNLGFTPRYISDIERLIRMGDCLPLPAFNDRAYVPFRNGVLNIATGVLLPTSPDFAGTWCLPYDYYALADCPVIKAWLLQAMNGDAEMVELLRAVLAAILMGRADLQVFFYLKGAGGTGKSTFIRLAEALVGKHNAHTTDLNNLETNRFETACLYRKRLAIVNDASKYGGGISVFKALTGQDPLRNERKNIQQLSASSFVFEGIVLLASNEDLVTNDLTSGIIRRQRNIEFSRVLTEDEKADWRKCGGEAAVLHAELPGLVNWLLQLSPEQVAAIINNPPMRAVRSNFEAMLANNRVARWMVEWCVPDPGAHTIVGQSRALRSKEDGSISYEYQGSQLFPSFLAFCAAEGVQPLSRDRFLNTLQGLAKALHHPILYKGKPGDNRRCFQGIALRGVEDPRFAWSSCLAPEELLGEDVIGGDFQD